MEGIGSTTQSFYVGEEDPAEGARDYQSSCYQPKQQRIVHFCDKSIKLCQITNIPNNNISGYGAKLNSPLDSSTAQDSKWPT